MSKWGRLGILMCLIITTQVWASIGKVSLLKGDAIANRDNQTIILANGTTLEEHDLITTKANSQIQLTFEDKTVITLGSESILDINQYMNDAQNPKAKFKFNQGTFKSITGNIGKKAPENFNLETKTATIGIRGTTVAGQLTTNDSNGIAIPETIGCVEGAIVVNTPQGSVNIAAGFATQIIPGQPPAPPAPLSPALLASLSGRNQQTPSSPPLLLEAQPTVAPTIVEQASQTNQQANQAQALQAAQTALDNYSDGFYPIFNPILRAASKNDGIISLSGFATSSYFTGDTTRTSNRETLTLNLDTSNDSITSSTITLLRDETLIPISLDKTASSSTMTYKNINRFAIKDFNDQTGWMQTENTYANDYVSWGYWAIKINDDSRLLPTTNYWVGGKDADAANMHVTSLIGNADTPLTSYTYNGNVIGTVINGGNSYSIDSTTNNAVRLIFDFGGGSGSLASTSYIKFQTNQAMPQSWQITPSGCVTSGSFSITNEGSVAINTITNGASYSAVKGQFYGTTAQAVGGTFSATSGANTATGVFKAVK